MNSSLLNEAQLKILNRALDLDTNPKSTRNHYSSTEDSPGFNDIMHLVELGFMKRVEGQPKKYFVDMYEIFTYYVTEAGIKFLNDEFAAKYKIFLGMEEEFEKEYGHPFRDRHWRIEAAVWAVSWKAALNTNKLSPYVY